MGQIQVSVSISLLTEQIFLIKEQTITFHKMATWLPITTSYYTKIREIGDHLAITAV